MPGAWFHLGIFIDSIIVLWGVPRTSKERTARSLDESSAASSARALGGGKAPKGRRRTGRGHAKLVSLLAPTRPCQLTLT